VNSLELTQEVGDDESAEHEKGGEQGGIRLVEYFCSKDNAIELMDSNYSTDRFAANGNGKQACFLCSRSSRGSTIHKITFPRFLDRQSEGTRTPDVTQTTLLHQSRCPSRFGRRGSFTLTQQ